MTSNTRIPEAGRAKAADREIRKRKITRVVWSLVLVAFGTVLSAFFQNYTVNGIPAPWLGYFLIGLGALALLGVNVFRGGPLDKRLDAAASGQAVVGTAPGASAAMTPPPTAAQGGAGQAPGGLSKHWYSVLGTGATINTIERTADGRVQFTVWISLFWVPLIPLSSWSAVYAGELPSGHMVDEGDAFTHVVRIHRDGGLLLQTFLQGLAVLVLAIAPTGILLVRTDGRVPTKIESLLLMASVAWPLILIFLAESGRRRKLKGI